MIEEKSFLNILEEEIDKISKEFWKLLKEVPIQEWEKKEIKGIGRVHVVGRAQYRYLERSIEQNRLHINLQKKYKTFINRVDFLMEQIPTEINKKYQAAKEEFEVWFYFKNNHFLTLDVETNKKRFYESVKKLKENLKLFENKEEIIIVPDTNALLTQLNPILYKEIVKKGKFTFLLLPIVISELDKLKATHQKKEVRSKAEKAIKRIKGWRQQGKITQGVRVDKTITIKSEVIEPNYQNMPKWLNKENNDDKILMSLLEIQTRYPWATIVLISRDINLLNKAEYMNILNMDMDLISKE